MPPPDDNASRRAAVFACDAPAFAPPADVAPYVRDGRRSPGSIATLAESPGVGAARGTTLFPVAPSGADFAGGATWGVGTEFVGSAGFTRSSELGAGTEFGPGTESGCALAISFAGATGLQMRQAIPAIASSATSIAAAGINHRGPASQSHVPAAFLSAASLPPARAIAASCSRQTAQREKCRS